MKLKLAAFAAALSISGSTQAQFYSGSEILAHLKENDAQSFQHALAVGYVAAVADAQMGTHCMPARVSLRQLTQVTVKFMENNPRALHMSAAFLVYRAMTEAWPCTK